MQKMVAVRPFTYATRHLVPGDVFQAKSNDSRLLLAIKKAKVVREPGTIDAPPEGVVQQAKQVAPASTQPVAEHGDIEKLRADAEALNVKIDMRWGAKRLQAEIDKALAG